MKTLYIDINNKPIQETDEIKLFTDEGSLQYAFFYELGSQLVGKVGKSIKKAKLISDFNSPENVEAFQKIITQWNVLKAMLFGEELEETFDVVIPKEFISWMSVHVDNEYRCIAAQYDKTKDYTVTIDVESFFEDAVDDEFKRNILKALKFDPEIEQIVFNDDAITKRSRIVKSIREKSDVVFVPFEKWNEKSVEHPVETSKPESNTTPLIATYEQDLTVGGFRVTVCSFNNKENIIFSGYYDHVNHNDSCLFAKNKGEKVWNVITPYGIATSQTKYKSDVDLLPWVKVSQRFETRDIFPIDKNIYVIRKLGENLASWSLYDLSKDETTTLFESKNNSFPKEVIDNRIVNFGIKPNHLYYDIVTKEWYDVVFGLFGVRIKNGNRCEVYSLKNGKQLLKDNTVVFVKEYGYDKSSKWPTIVVSEDNELGAAFDVALNKVFVFDHTDNILYLEQGEELIHKDYPIDFCLFSNDNILTKKNHELVIKNILNSISFRFNIGQYDNLVKIMGSPCYGLIPCLCDVKDFGQIFTFIRNNKFICVDNSIGDILLPGNNLKENTYIRVSKRRGLLDGLKDVTILSETLFLVEIDYRSSLYKIVDDKITILESFVSSILYQDSDYILIQSHQIKCFSKKGDLVSIFENTYNNRTTVFLK